ncbi:MAG: putative MipA family outer rane scaffold protein [Rubritepida sp.]|nr:putative MipA family outer rane scaffold protein [Rubritepida sp.]
MALPLPYLSGGYGTRFDFDILDGATYSMIEAGGFSAGFAARWQLGRSFHDSKARLRGLRHISRSFEIGGFAAYEAGPLALQATLTQDVTRSHHGAELEIRALAQGAIGHVAVSAGPHLIAVTQPFAQAFYGVSAEEARASGLPAYRPGGGIERIGLMGTGEWRLTDRTSLIGVFDYSRLIGDIGRSPLASAPGGTRHQLDVGVFLTYRLF